MFKNLRATINESFQAGILQKELRLVLASYATSIPTARLSNSGTDHYLFGYMECRQQYPATYIHKETIREKIEDVFLKRDVDFPHSKKFSGKFQVITEDKDMLQSLLQFSNLNELAGFPDMEVELSGNIMLFRPSRKSVSLQEAEIFCNLAKALLNIFK